ncbi:MAG: signal recognition particle-docking protein FtsY [Lysobacterales bacterium 69-70]|nr:signal recognition particle-docking protein FtsY [Xanthomonadaceae bacterium]ODU34505.1 MAG: signal recognition particle-docking protein FtsY [Xanthomonadaceae bacterium SCN 69-320]ODV19563.1 MAG: signal recognition particle-docking protein FtsY [Xanthomonadaceae bacterium SCN 69-25]OJY94773.1 MAG: signal recognition particle-docking protein FtsY [Xanthomonadales bacterium 69-70]
MFKFWKKTPKPVEPPVAPAGEAVAETPAPEVAPAVVPEAAAAALAPEVASYEVAAEAAAQPAAEAPVEEAPVFDPPAMAAPAAAPGKKSWRERLSGSAFARSLGSLFSRKPKLDEALLEELETALITADVGVAASTELVEDLRKRLNRREFDDADQLLAALRQALIELVTPIARPLQVDASRKPFVMLMVGVNGVGKTTTIGKLTRRYQQQGLDVMLAAGDTFRAAAVEQLKTWGERNQVPVVAQGSGSDAASVIFDALQSARSRGLDLLIADTAGRLHTQGGLMDELGKIRRVLGKLDADAPHEVLLVLDGTTGQNAINQVRQFRAAIGVTGLVVTKLDGTAKGGVIFALAKEFGLPVRFVGLGESLDDLREFDAAAFVDGLLPAALGG